ncbi:hypothetical protein RIR_jg33682.t1 [Rhizophagus irregularis DAOM 181602=DAOM 197198]|nr:hypothetical protein RIR_jg33682.t1 [Rhizophagus irregularis DAOM 181602=DAOM 197198]
MTHDGRSNLNPLKFVGTRVTIIQSSYVGLRDYISHILHNRSRTIFGDIVIDKYQKNLLNEAVKVIKEGEVIALPNKKNFGIIPSRYYYIAHDELKVGKIVFLKKKENAYFRRK